MPDNLESLETRAKFFLELLDTEWRRYCDDGDSAGYRHRNGLIWEAIRKAPPAIERIVQREIDRGA